MDALVKRCGSPLAAVQEIMYGDTTLPDGAVPHMLSVPQELKTTMTDVLREYHDVFPAELPKLVPPDRKLGDVHDIPVEPGTKPVKKRMYKHSP